MISEIWKANFDVKAIYRSLTGLVPSHPAKEVYPGYGGWSVLSEDGDLHSGWNEEAVVFNEKGEMDLIKSYEKKQQLGFMKESLHDRPTSFMTKELDQVYQTLLKYDLQPNRMRISVLKAGKELYWHSDAPPTEYAVRLHIPLFTNSECFFETEEGREHFVADGSAYFINVNRRHRVINHGKTDRWHLIMNVTDSNGFTKFHSKLK